MDNLSKMISDILADEQSRNMLSELADSLGLSGGSEPDEKSTQQSDKLDLSALTSLLSSSNDEGKSDDDGFNLNPETMLKIGKALSSLKTDDKDVALLRAIKPFISDERKHKVDEAVKILKLLSHLPLLKDSGFLGGIL